jgi:hypothetical protein
MPGETKNGMQCAEFDSLLSDALDGLLSGLKLESFQNHSRVCPVCGPLFADVAAGQHWLKSMGEVEAPPTLVTSILAGTTGIDTARMRSLVPSGGMKMPFTERAREWVGSFVSPVFATMRQPRFAMSFGMVFFSLSVALSVAGVKPADLAHVDLRPAAIKRTYYSTTGKVVKYYENIRFVYEIESRVRELKRATQPAEPGPSEREPRKNNTSGQPEQRQERNYSRGENQPVLASLPDSPPEVTVTTIRRFV